MNLYKPKKSFYYCTLFLCSAITFSYAQEAPPANKNIGLCNLYADTLSIEQLKNCQSITINSDKKAIVTSYKMSYYLADQMTLCIVESFDSTIKKEDMEKMLSIKPRSLYFTEVIGEDKTGILIFGHRWIYLK